MLLSSWFLAGILLIVHSALCSEVQDNSSVNNKKIEESQEGIESYRYNHPPEVPDLKSFRKEKSINSDEHRSVPSGRSRSRATRRRTTLKTSTKSELEIPVKVIYDAETTTPHSNRRQTTSKPIERTTKTLVHRRRLHGPNISKKIDIRQTKSGNDDNDNLNINENAEISTELRSNVTSTTDFPKRSRDSYFKKRTGTPPPKVKILEEKNFVFAHSGNFHYSFLGGDGTKVSSQGELKSFDDDKTGEAVSGSVFYKDKDGNDFSLSYTADENGYRPVGAHLPTPPPLPPAIARALKYIADRNTPSPNTEDAI